MRKWWRKLKNKWGWDFKKIRSGKRFHTRLDKNGHTINQYFDDNGIYTYKCSYCGMFLTFPWKETHLAYHNMQRHIKAKHIDTL